MHLHWRVRSDFTSWYAAALTAAGRRSSAVVPDEYWEAVDAALRRAAGESGEREERAAATGPPAAFWQQVAGTAAHQPDDLPPEAAVEATLASWPEWAEREDSVLAAAHELLARTRRRWPQLEHELTLRSRPLCELWEACGPGLLHQIRRTAPEADWQATCQVAWVYPLLGGAGWSCRGEGVACCEALLVNPHPGLPEVLRLAWRVVEAAVRRPSGDATDDETWVARVVWAGQQLELVRGDAAGVAEALREWLGRSSAEAVAWSRRWEESRDRQRE